jgi:hypothetical protein
MDGETGARVRDFWHWYDKDFPGQNGALHPPSYKEGPETPEEWADRRRRTCPECGSRYNPDLGHAYHLGWSIYDLKRDLP